jgi:dGTPase
VKSGPARFDRLSIEREDNRSPGKRDRDRILYTSAFQRLAEVTQVISPDEGHVFHNRLTHSLKVAQVAKRTAERLLAVYPRAGREIDADVVEAAALAHDIGHPPFGHIAEEELNDLVTNTYKLLDGFDGNAQSFRIVSSLALRVEESRGLNLTRATLNAILKYPWLRNPAHKDGKKWGVYSTEQSIFEFARVGGAPGSTTKSIEADLMDLADDITYAVHDVADFYRAGMIPLERFADDGNSREMGRFFAEVFERREDLSDNRSELESAFKKLVEFMPFHHPYSGRDSDRSTLRAFTSGLISNYIEKGVSLPLNGGLSLQVDPNITAELTMLKQLTWHYVIVNPALATQQYGQRKVIRDLFSTFRVAADSNGGRVLFPFAFRELLEKAGSGDSASNMRTRIVCDYIAGMTERQALALHLKLTGVRPGSGLH